MGATRSSPHLVAALLIGQFVLMPRLIQNPRKWAVSYNATGTTLVRPWHVGERLRSSLNRIGLA